VLFKLTHKIDNRVSLAFVSQLKFGKAALQQLNGGGKKAPKNIVFTELML
jgi:hypothetical protein